MLTKEVKAKLKKLSDDEKQELLSALDIEYEADTDYIESLNAINQKIDTILQTLNPAKAKEPEAKKKSLLEEIFS